MKVVTTSCSRCLATPLHWRTKSASLFFCHSQQLSQGPCVYRRRGLLTFFCFSICASVFVSICVWGRVQEAMCWIKQRQRTPVGKGWCKVSIKAYHGSSAHFGLLPLWEFFFFKILRHMFQSLRQRKAGKSRKNIERHNGGGDEDPAQWGQKKPVAVTISVSSHVMLPRSRCCLAPTWLQINKMSPITRSVVSHTNLEDNMPHL